MIKLTYKLLNAEPFNMAMNHLKKQNGFANFQVTYNVSKISRKMEQELKTARELYLKWADTYMVKGEDGKYIPAEAGQPNTPWKIVDGKEEEFAKGMESFLDTEVEIQAHPLKPSDLGAVKLTPEQIIALEPIFDSSAFDSELAGH